MWSEMKKENIRGKEQEVVGQPGLGWVGCDSDSWV